MALAGSGQSYWERNAGRYDRALRPLAKPFPRTLELVAEATRGADRVLELAAGTGLVTPSIARSARSVVATDYADAMVAQLRERVIRDNLSNVDCEQADIYALTYAPQSFDAVVAANVLHLVPDWEAAIAAMKRVLKPSGVLVVPTFVHDQTLLSTVVSRLLSLTGFPGQRRFSAESLINALGGQGLAVTRRETLPGLIPIEFVSGSFRD